MKILTKDDLASIIDVDKLRSAVDEKIEVVGNVVKKEQPKKGIMHIVKVTLIVVAVIAAVCAAAYAIYRFFTPDYDDEFDDDFDDAFDDDDDLFDDEKN